MRDSEDIFFFFFWWHQEAEYIYNRTNNEWRCITPCLPGPVSLSLRGARWIWVHRPNESPPCHYIIYFPHFRAKNNHNYYHYYFKHDDAIATQWCRKLNSFDYDWPRIFIEFNDQNWKFIYIFCFSGMHSTRILRFTLRQSTTSSRLMAMKAMPVIPLTIPGTDPTTVLSQPTTGNLFILLYVFSFLFFSLYNYY